LRFGQILQILGHDLLGPFFGSFFSEQLEFFRLPPARVKLLQAKLFPRFNAQAVQQFRANHPKPLGQRVMRRSHRHTSSPMSPNKNLSCSLEVGAVVAWLFFDSHRG
jgi:hypothetical protein